MTGTSANSAGSRKLPPGRTWADLRPDPELDPARIADYAGRFERLLSVALPAAESVEVIQAAAESMG